MDRETSSEKVFNKTILQYVELLPLFANSFHPFDRAKFTKESGSSKK
jgi:hypothetical protein